MRSVILYLYISKTSLLTIRYKPTTVLMIPASWFKDTTLVCSEDVNLLETNHFPFKQNYAIYLKKWSTICVLLSLPRSILICACNYFHNDLPNKSMTLKQNSMQKLKKSKVFLPPTWLIDFSLKNWVRNLESLKLVMKRLHPLPEYSPEQFFTNGLFWSLDIHTADVYN